VSKTLRSSFLPCPHGHGWYLELQDHAAGGVLAQLSYPCCTPCFNGAPPRKPELGCSDEAWLAYDSTFIQWKGNWRSGQTAWSNGKGYKHDDITMAMSMAAAAVGEILQVDASYSPKIEAYMCYTDGDYQVWPHLKDDVFFAACYYDVKFSRILTADGRRTLIYFHRSPRPFDVMDCDLTFGDAAEEPVIQRAYAEFKKVHVQRDGELRSRTWFAWLLSEYLKDDLTDVPTVERERMVEL
jgi:hypothetical protein